MPLSHPPGEAQVDFGQARILLNGIETTMAMFVMTLPYSDAIFVCVYPRERTEAFVDSHCRAFACFGGVPKRISYDNTKIAVKKVLGDRGSEPVEDPESTLPFFIPPSTKLAYNSRKHGTTIR